MMTELQSLEEQVDARWGSHAYSWGLHKVEDHETTMWYWWCGFDKAHWGFACTIQESLKAMLEVK